MTSSRRLDDQRDGGGETFPLSGLGFQRLPSMGSEPVVLRAAVVLTHVPLGFDPALLFELVERGIQRALADAQLLAGQLPDALRDRPAVHRLERQDAEDQQVECPLHESGRLAHRRAPVASRFRRTRERKQPRRTQRAQRPFSINRDIGPLLSVTDRSIHGTVTLVTVRLKPDTTADGSADARGQYQSAAASGFSRTGIRTVTRLMRGSTVICVVLTVCGAEAA